MLDRRTVLRGGLPGVRAAWLGFVLICAATPHPALAQFNFFQPSEASVQDVYDAISDHGFRLAGPLMRNGDVYVADVVDRSRRRERLIIAARSGQIIQRFFVDLGGPNGRSYSAGVAGVPRAARNQDDNFFSRLSRGFADDGPPPRPPLGLGDRDEPAEAVAPPVAPKRIVRPRPTDIEPRVATRREEAPITSAPLPLTPAPANAPTVAPVRPAAPSVASVPPSSAPSPSPPSASASRPTVVSVDPLRIPGEKPKPVAETAAAKPAPAKAADVPVAPLD